MRCCIHSFACCHEPASASWCRDISYLSCHRSSIVARELCAFFLLVGGAHRLFPWLVLGILAAIAILLVAWTTKAIACGFAFVSLISLMALPKLTVGQVNLSLSTLISKRDTLLLSSLTSVLSFYLITKYFDDREMVNMLVFLGVGRSIQGILGLAQQALLYLELPGRDRVSDEFGRQDVVYLLSHSVLVVIALILCQVLKVSPLTLDMIVAQVVINVGALSTLAILTRAKYRSGLFLNCVGGFGPVLAIYFFGYEPYFFTLFLALQQALAALLFRRRLFPWVMGLSLLYILGNVVIEMMAVSL